jgi:hypothetical protein
MRRCSFLVAAVFFVLSSTARSHVVMPLEAHTHLNVGVRLAWNTMSGDIVWGFEASYTFWGDLTHGPVLSLDVPTSGPRLGLGYELVMVPPAIGIETGPSLAITDGELEAGWHATGFIGFLLFVYDEATWLPSGDVNELGLMLKAPIPVVEKDFSGSAD